MAKLTEDFNAVLPGEIYPKTFSAGTECPDPLITIARSLGIVQDENKKAPATKARKAAPENKMIKSAPENKGA